MAKVVKTIKVKINNPNQGKEEALFQTVDILNKVLASFLDFTLLNRRSLLTKTKKVVSKKTGEIKERKCAITKPVRKWSTSEREPSGDG
jgi:hypothetical protein